MASIWKQIGGPAEVAGQQCGGRRQPAARARPHERHPVRVHAERVRLGVQVGQRGVAVVQAGRVGVLGSQPVLDRDDDRPGVDRGHGGTAVLGLDAADHEPAAVDHDDARRPLRPPTRPWAGTPAPARPGRPATPAPCGHRSRAVSTPGMSTVMATRISSNARRAAAGSERSSEGTASTNAASSGSDHRHASPMSAVYLGCMRMPASMRIDSALM